MRPTWLIEAGVYGDEAVPLVAEIRRQGFACEVIPHQAIKKGATLAVAGQPLAAGACVIGYGTFPFAQQILLHHSWTPGAWCSAAKLDCTAYFAYFGKYLLNQNYVIMPGVEAMRQRDWLFEVFGKDEAVFGRPTSCYKLFVGRCISRETFCHALAPTRYDPETLVVVATPQVLGREWRLVVAGDRVVAGSQYAVQGQREIATTCPGDVIQYAEAMLADVSWRPDPIFMLDICECGNDLRLVELNSFSSSWFYACDLSAVVATASSLAEQRWAQPLESR